MSESARGDFGSRKIEIYGKVFSGVDIWEMLENINEVMKSQDSVYCLQEAVERYVYAMQEFFDGNKSLENVKQSFYRELGCTICIRCNNLLDKSNYEFNNLQDEFICNKCLQKDVK